MGYEIDFLAVGDGEKSGDAIALRYGNLHGLHSEQTVITIDGGTMESGEALVKHVLQNYGTNRVDVAFLSHPDNDHASGMRQVLEKLEVGKAAMHLPWDHSGRANSVLRGRWHNHLSKLLGKPFPSADEERGSPAAADEIYEAATRLLIGKTRDTKTYPLVYKENVSYGFCRNLYAMRGLGKTVAILGLLLSSGAGWWYLRTGNGDLLPWGCAVVCAALSLWWFFTVTSEWVKVPAMNYAQHLFESCEKLARARKPAEAKKS